MPGIPVGPPIDMGGNPQAALQLANRRLLSAASEQLGAALAIAYEGRSAEPVLQRIGINIINRVHRKMKQHGSGIVYEKYNPRRTHQASAPGEPPATDLGRLDASYNWRTGDNRGRPYLDVGSNEEVAPYLEFGTSTIAARPALRPAVEEERNRIGEMIRAHYAARLGAAAGPGLTS